MWELDTSLLPKEMQDFLFDNIQMKDGSPGGMLRCNSIFDILTQFKNMGLLKLTHETRKIKHDIWAKLERLYNKYREIVWSDYSNRIKEFKEQIMAEIIANE